jgi:hypothetical protein
MRPAQPCRTGLCWHCQQSATSWAPAKHISKAKVHQQPQTIMGTIEEFHWITQPHNQAGMKQQLHTKHTQNF